MFKVSRTNLVLLRANTPSKNILLKCQEQTGSFKSLHSLKKFTVQSVKNKPGPFKSQHSLKKFTVQNVKNKPGFFKSQHSLKIMMFKMQKPNGLLSKPRLPIKKSLKCQDRFFSEPPLLNQRYSCPGLTLTRPLTTHLDILFH